MWDKKNSERVVVLLQRSQLSLFRSSTGKIVNLPFESSIVQDLEVLNEDGFCKYLTAFIQQQKLSKTSVILLLDSSIYFSQKAEPQTRQDKSTIEKNTTTEKTKEKIEKNSLISELENKKKLFAQSVPFANVFSTIITIGKEKFFIALNRDFYEPVIKVFSGKDLQVISILPVAVISPLLGDKGFTPETAMALINSVEKYKTHDFLEGTLKAETPIVSTALPSDPSDKKRLTLMIALFVILIGVLIAVIFWSRQQEQQLSQPPVSPPVAVQQPPPTPVATPEVATAAATLSELLASTESGTINTEEISVTIIDASGDDNGSDFGDRLEEVGFGEVEYSQAATITGPMIVNFSSNIPIQLQEALQSQLVEWGYQARYEEEPDQTNTITITLTNQ